MGQLLRAVFVVGDSVICKGCYPRWLFPALAVLARRCLHTPQPVTDDYLASRPFLEFHVRRRVQALDDANLLYGQDVTEPLAMTDE